MPGVRANLADLLAASACRSQYSPLRRGLGADWQAAPRERANLRLHPALRRVGPRGGWLRFV